MGLSARGAVLAAFWLVIDVVEAVLRVALALPSVAWRAFRVTRDLARSRHALRGGVLHCPAGHEVPTEGDVYECHGCGFVYGGRRASIWECGNPECRAITPDVRCSTCGLSCRNPYRWG